MSTASTSSNGGVETGVEVGAGIVCPYCGHTQTADGQCDECGGLFEPLSRQASQNDMGPWFIRDDDNPFRPGCSYPTLRRLALRGRIGPETILRGPTTRQFWAFARNTPGVANLLGECHNCHAPAGPDTYMCAGCGAVFTAPEDRQSLGLSPVRLLPGQAPAHVVAASTSPRPAAGPTTPTPTPPTPPAPLPPPTARPPTPAVAATSADPRPATAPQHQQQQRAIRRLKRRIAGLWWAVLLLAALSLTSLTLLIAIGGADRLRVGAPSAPAVPPEGEGLQPPTPESDLATPPAAGARAPDQQPPDEWEQRRDAALELAREDTVEAVTRAVDLLEQIASDAPEGRRPNGLDDDLQRLRARLDELRLREIL